MALLLVGLVCLCFMRFAWAQEKVGRETLEDEYSHETYIGIYLFLLIDQEINPDAIVTFPEFYKFWSRVDSNKDKHLSTQEVKMLLKEHKLGQSSDAELIFGETDLTDTLSVIITFKLFDRNGDDILRSPEFVDVYTTILNTF